MATLYERLTGVVPPEEAESLEKIPIHAFREIMHDFNRGSIKGSDLATAFSLDSSQILDATTIYQKSNLVSNKEAYFNRLFGQLVLAEIGVLPEKYNETSFWAWVNGIS